MVLQHKDWYMPSALSFMHTIVLLIYVSVTYKLVGFTTQYYQNNALVKVSGTQKFSYR